MTKPERRTIAERALAGYAGAVADELDLPRDAVLAEVSDTAAVYLPLARRCVRYPGRDLMLVWSGRRGWSVALESTPRRPLEVIAYFGDEERFPQPHAVASFVEAALDHDGVTRAPEFPVADLEETVERRLGRFAGQDLPESGFPASRDSIAL
ncbi:DUF6292 family protein [Amycolatopsis pigmentata]|uniref:DUF6292 family protein n=1 Tax=Amycolatopsis pigmentata TaxID=450801 RepID=A0ABW5G1P2_9PSEU